jgi:hypothetical protein
LDIYAKYIINCYFSCLMDTNLVDFKVRLEP